MKNMKRVICWIITVMLVINMLPFAAFAADGAGQVNTDQTNTEQTNTAQPVTFEVVDVSVPTGTQEVVVPVNIKNNPGFLGGQFFIEYDKNNLTLTDVSLGKDFSAEIYAPSLEEDTDTSSEEDTDTSSEEYTDTSKLVITSYVNSGFVMLDNTKEVDGDGELLKLTFKINDPTKTGNYTINIIVDELYDKDIVELNREVDSGSVTVGVAKIGETVYTTIDAAIKAAQSGETVYVFAGTYAVPSMKAGITIEGAVNADGTPAVLFEGTLSGTLENLTLKNIHIKGGNAQRWAYAKGDLVFENVTFEATSVYALHFDGIAAGTNLTYKNCTIIGWAAMGGTPESCVFDGCTIKGNGTYGLIRTYFDATIKNCTFDVANTNTADIYEDGIHAVDGAEVTVTNCTNINGDMKDIINVHADSVVILGNEKIQNVAKIGDTYYATIDEAIAAAQAGETVTILAGNYTTNINVNKAITVVGEGVVNISGKLNVTANGATVKNLNVNNGGSSAGYISAKDVLIEGCTIVGGNGFRSCYTSGTVTFKDSTITGATYGIHFDGSAGGNIVIDNCVITGWTSFASTINKVTISDTTFAEGNYNYIRFYQKEVVIDGCTFNEKMGVDIANSVNATVIVTNSTVENGNIEDLFEGADIVNSNITVDNEKLVRVAKIGNVYYETLAEAFTAAQNGDEVVILKAGTYALSTSGKNITITGAVDGIEFDCGQNNIGMNGASITFNNVTFNWAANGWPYHGLAHCGEMEYNDCTFNGTVFLYGTSETFNNCEFKVTGDTYNVWTYSANKANFNKCTFNSDGKALLIYHEGASQFNEVTITESTFNASSAVAGKAAIEMDSSLTAGIKLTIDAATTATGFGSGNVSGNSLWNNKKGNNTDANNDITVVVNGETVLGKVTFVAKIGETGYTTINAAITAAQAGDTVTILAGEYTENLNVNKSITVVGEGTVKFNGKLNITADNATVKNLSFNNGSGNGGYINAKDVTIDGCTVVGGNGFRYCYTSGTVTFKNSTITGSTYGIHFDGNCDGNVVIEKCVITGWTSFASTIDEVTISETEFANGNYNQLRFYQDAELTNVKFNPNMNIDFGTNGVSATFTGCTVTDGSPLTDVIYLPDIAQMGIEVKVNDTVVVVEAMIGNTAYLTLAEAFAAAKDGDEVKIYVAGTYALSTSGKDITITGAVDGVIFDNIGAHNMGGASVTFNNVTFDYYPNVNYTGLQHSGNLVYNNCTFNGQVFLYGASETFNNCTFNQNSADAYNVWTYGAKKVAFNECTFNSVGKAVLVYTETKTATTELNVVKTTFNASAPVDGKAAIEIDTSLSAGATITIDAATTATGFGSGNVSGNSLWNNKKGSNTDATNDLTVVVDNVTVLAPVTFVAKIGETGYTTLAAALAAAQAGDVVDLLGNSFEDVKRFDPKGITLKNGSISFKKGEQIRVSGDVVFDNVDLTFDMEGTASYPNAAIFIGGKYATSITLKNGTNVLIKNPSYTAIYNDTSSAFYTLNIDASTLTIEDQGDTTGINLANINLTNGATLTTSNTGIAINGGSVNVDGTSVVTINGTKSHGITNVVLNVAAGGKVDIDNCAFLGLNIKDGSSIAEGAIVTVDNCGTSGNYVGIPARMNGTISGYDQILVNNAKIVATGASGNAFNSIEAAINAAKAGETVTILAGNYTTNISVNKAITVVGETDDQGNNLVKINGGISITADNATVKNLNASNPSTSGYNCTLSINAKDVLVEGCEITDANAMRYCETTGKVTFKDCVLTATDTWAIHFDGKTGGEIVVDNCEVNGWIAFAGSLNTVTLTDSTFAAGKWAGGRTYNKNIVIDGCTFEAGYKFDLASEDATVTVTDTKMSDGSSAIELFNKEDLCGQNEVKIDGNEIAYVAKIGNTYYATLEEALANVTDYTSIKLVANATLDYGAREAYGRDTTTDIIIDGQGFTLTLNQKNSDWASIGMANADGKLTLKNMTIEKTGYGDTSGTWNTHAIIFSCDVEMNKVTVNNAIAVAADATLTNVTINEANGYYGLWIEANGQTVTVTGGAINATNGGRGIKIADQYIDNPASVTLNVTDTVFNTAKKAAVLVSSTEGANITASNVNITNVAEDKVNFVWVDEDWADNYGKVTVNDAPAAQENLAAFNAAIVDGNKVVGYYKTLEAAIKAAQADDTIALLTPYIVEKGEEVTIDLTGKTLVYSSAVAGEAMITNKGTLTLKNGTVAYTYTGTATTSKAANAISNYGTLTIDGTNVSNTTEANGQIGYAIDNFGVLTVNGGKITATGSNYYDGIRMFCASETVKVSVVVNGGEISSIWMQNASDGSSGKNMKDVLGSLTITNGKIENVWLEPSAKFEAAITGGYIGKVAYNETAEGRDLIGFISGGTFANEFANAYCAPGFIAEKNDDGTWTVVEGDRGDINGDGEATSKDVVLLRQYVAKLPTAMPINVSMADVNGDGDVTVKDIVMLRRIVAKLIS